MKYLSLLYLCIRVKYKMKTRYVPFYLIISHGGKEMKLLFIVNPTAGKGRAARVIPEIKAAMVQFGEIEYDISYSEKPGHATEISKNAASQGYDIVFAVGGDGTVNEVINGLVNTSSALGVIPRGSGNDFVRTLGIKGDTAKIIKDTIAGIKKQIDVGCINNRYFINIASVGFDAEVVLATQKAKRFFLSDSAAYIAGVISTIFIRKPSRVKMIIGEKEIEDDILLLAVANGKYYGGGMMVAPDAILDDGEFEICVISSMPKIKMLFLFPQFIKGKHKKFKEVSFYKSDKVYTESLKPIAINVDGEVFNDTNVRFDMIKKGLLVIVSGE